MDENVGEKANRRKSATAPPAYPVPSSVADEESVSRYFNLDLTKLDGARLGYELRLAEEAIALIPPRYFIDRDWWSGRRAAVLAEMMHRRGTGVSIGLLRAHLGGTQTGAGSPRTSTIVVA